jgi:hypothetical protein
MTPEGRTKAKVRRALHELRPVGFVFMPVPQGLQAAALDYYCCIDGRFVAIETKIDKKKLTARQIFNANEIANAGGMVFVIRNNEDIATMLNALKDPHHGAAIFDTLGSVENYGELWCT